MTKNVVNERAKFAFEKVSKLHGEALQKYRSHVRSLPAMILSNGFGLAMAFIYSKKETKILYEHISTWLKKQDILRDMDKNKDLMGIIAESGIDTYRFLEAETLALLEWLKRLAEGADSQ